MVYASPLRLSPSMNVQKKYNFSLWECDQEPYRNDNTFWYTL